MPLTRSLVPAVLLVTWACGGGDPAAIDAAPSPAADAGPADAAPAIDKSGACAADFGNQLTNSFGRLDGTVLAVVRPTDTQCPLPNSDHVVVQVSMGGAAYRMVVNVNGLGADPRVSLDEVDAALVGPGWAEGWHPGIALDYVATLKLHSTGFRPHAMDDLINVVTDELELGGKVSVFATSSGGSYAGSAHLVHRNRANADGAIVLRPDSAKPRYLLFRFANQTF